MPRGIPNKPATEAAAPKKPVKRAPWGSKSRNGKPVAPAAEAPPAPKKTGRRTANSGLAVELAKLRKQNVLLRDLAMRLLMDAIEE